MIVNIDVGVFGSTIRMGDLIACANVVEHFRFTQNDRSIKFHIKSRALHASKHCADFYTWLCANTDYFTSVEGDFNLPWRRVNLWDYRDIAGDLVKIPNKVSAVKKVVVNPLFDADYNTYRNWPSSVFDNVISWVEQTFSGYELVITSQKPITKPGWRNVTNLAAVLNEIMSADTYIGGDTGLSHFVGALERGPDPIYYYSSRGLLHTTPINWHTNKKGVMRTYWCDFENTQW